MISYELPVNIMIANLVEFVISYLELGFVALGVGLAVWGSVHKRRRRYAR